MGRNLAYPAPQHEYTKERRQRWIDAAKVEQQSIMGDPAYGYFSKDHLSNAASVARVQYLAKVIDGKASPFAGPPKPIPMSPPPKPGGRS